MSEEQQPAPFQRQHVRAVRHARRYLRANTGALARILNTYKATAGTQDQHVYLPEQ